MPTLDDPDLLCEPGPALLSALAWWGESVPDAENLSVEQVTRRVNGGTNGLADRRHLMAGNDPILRRLAAMDDLRPIVLSIPKAAPAKPAAPGFWQAILNIFRRKP